MRWHYRRNPDVHRRELERAAAAGDPEARMQLLVESVRTDRIDYESAVGIGVTYGGPILGWTPSWEHPGYIELSPPDASWNVCLVSGPWWDREGTSFSPVSVAPSDMSQQIPLRDLFTPMEGDLQSDVDNYREQLAGVITALSMAGTAILARVMTPHTAERRMNEGLSGA